ncbi:MAG: guanylate kinase [Holosporales bacterium]|jgi:guanylate kinase|nr:guanylate kinase [Holosporales bacterium]
MKKFIFVFSGPSGAGKTTLIKHVLKTFNGDVDISVSCTTRAARIGETDAVDYHFITKNKFEKFIGDGQFLEYTDCYGNQYGTLKSTVLDLLTHNKACILDVDYRGAKAVLHGDLSDADGSFKIQKIGILVLPPSIEALKQRLLNRRSETKESLNKRISESFNGESIAKYDHVIINDDISRSKKEVQNIVKLYLK